MMWLREAAAAVRAALAAAAAEHTVDFEVENHFHAKLLFRALNVRYDDVLPYRSLLYSKCTL